MLSQKSNSVKHFFSGGYGLQSCRQYTELSRINIAKEAMRYGKSTAI
jgi:hypothetical protein